MNLGWVLRVVGMQIFCLFEQAKKLHKWTEFEVEELFRMKDEGMKDNDIAKELGFTLSSVKNKLKLTTRHVTHSHSDTWSLSIEKVKDANLVKCWLPHDGKSSEISMRLVEHSTSQHCVFLAYSRKYGL